MKGCAIDQLNLLSTTTIVDMKVAPEFKAMCLFATDELCTPSLNRKGHVCSHECPQLSGQPLKIRIQPMNLTNTKSPQVRGNVSFSVS